VRALRAHALALTATVAFLALGARAAPVGAEPRAGAAFRLIVNPANPIASVDRNFVSEAFLKKTTRWPNDELIRPVDLGPDSSVRHHFSDDVLKRSVAAVKSYWQQMVFSGRGLPPPELDNEDQVVRFVLKNPGAVGYVSGSVNIDRAKVIPVRW
jgi:ABC-type phosphate transport system substrate-binding protein